MSAFFLFFDEKCLKGRRKNKWKIQNLKTNSHEWYSCLEKIAYSDFYIFYCILFQLTFQLLAYFFADLY